MFKLKNLIVVLLLIIIINYSFSNDIEEIINLYENENRFDNLDDKNIKNFNFSEKTNNELRFLIDNSSLNKTENFIDKSCNRNLSGNDFFQFIPSFEGKLTNEDQSIEYENNCGSKTIISLDKLSKNETILKFKFLERGLLCYDLFIIATSNIHKYRFLSIFSSYSIKFINLSDNDVDEIKVNGIRIFTFCQYNLFNVILSYYKTLELFGVRNIFKLFDKNPNFQEDAIFDFLNRYIDFPQIPRKLEYQNKILEIDENIIKTGDHFSISGTSPYAALIQYGDYGRTNHAAFACRYNSTLFVCESSGMLGVRKVPYKKWMEEILSKNESAVLIPLSLESRQKFNETLALEFFESVEGLPWGDRNFFFTFFDTPKDSMPSEINAEFILPFFSFYNKKTFFQQNIILESLNYRLKTENLTLSEVVAEAARKGITFEELLAMPELDNIKYSKGPSYACSSLNIAFWKAGGLFGNMEINAAEFTVRDVYELRVFDHNFKDTRPDICKEVDPYLDYCQIVGKYSLDLPFYNSIEPYSNMNERCPRLPPGQRLENC